MLETEKRWIKMLEGTGMTVKSYDEQNGIFEAERETARGTIHIYGGVNGTARLDKPNGTHKWLYDKSVAQVGAAIRQTLAFYR
jgi:hypothetical protein